MARAVHPQHPDDAPRPAVEGHEAALLGRADDHLDVVARPRATGELDLHVVLIAPEPRDRIERLGLGLVVVGQQASSGGLAHLDGRLPVLDPQQLAEAGAGPAGDVSGGHHPGRGGQRVVGDDAVIDVQPRTLDPAGVGRHPDADQDHRGLDARAVAEAHRLDPVGAVQPVDAHAQAQVHPVVAVQRGHDHAHLGAQGPFEGRGRRLQHGHLDPAGSAHRRHLRPDETGPDHHDALGLLVEVAPQDEAVVQGAQDVHAFEHRRPGQPTGGGAGGDHQPVVADPLPAIEAHEAIRAIEAHGPASEAVVDAQVLVGGRQDDAIDIPDPGQHLLRQRRPVIGCVGIGVDHRDGALEALAAQRVSRVHPRQGRPDDDHRSDHGCFLPPAERCGRPVTPRRWRWPAWAALHRLFDLGPFRLRWRLVQDVQEVVVPDLEDLRGDPHADRVALTQIEVDDHSHSVPLS